MDVTTVHIGSGTTAPAFDTSWGASTAVPVLVLMALAVILPVLVARRFQDTQGGLSVALLIAALMLMAVATALVAWMYLVQNADTTILRDAPLAATLYFLSIGAKTSILWAPIVLLTGFSLAQGIERRKGEAMAARK